jgi:hypothetical protein
MIIEIKNGVTIGTPQPNRVLQEKYPTVSFPVEPQPSDLDEFGYGVYIPVVAPNAEVYQKVVEGTPEQHDNQKWYQVWEIVDMTPEEIDDKNKSLRANNKKVASQLLSYTDWTQMPDVDLVNKADFTAYRAEVRAIALNPPVTVSDWPVKPEEVWSTESL